MHVAGAKIGGARGIERTGLRQQAFALLVQAFADEGIGAAFGNGLVDLGFVLGFGHGWPCVGGFPSLSNCSEGKYLYFSYL